MTKGDGSMRSEEPTQFGGADLAKKELSEDDEPKFDDVDEV